MKKRFFCAALAAVLTIFPLCIPASAETEQREFAYAGADPVSYLEEFVTECPKREAGTSGELAAAEFLARKYEEFGFRAYAEDGEMIQPFTFRSVSSRNVLAVKPMEGKEFSDPATKIVVLSAHMDNAAKEMPEGYQGAYDNGSGVATLLAVAENLKDVDLPFHVLFANFGAEEPGMYGSQAFMEGFLGRVSRVLLEVNFDVVGGGEHLYLYTDEVKSSYDTYIRRIAQKLGVSIADNPKNKKVLLSGMGKFPYTHVGMMSDNSVFMARGVPCAFLFSYDWGNPALGITEGNGAKVMHSPDDNLSHLNANYRLHMRSASALVSELLKDGEFIKEMTNIEMWDYSALLSRGLALGLYLGLILLGAVFVVIKYFRLKNPPSAPPDPEKPEEKRKVFDDFE